jgi:hypothetical protein
MKKGCVIGLLLIIIALVVGASVTSSPLEGLTMLGLAVVIAAIVLTDARVPTWDWVEATAWDLAQLRPGDWVKYSICPDQCKGKPTKVIRSEFAIWSWKGGVGDARGVREICFRHKLAHAGNPSELETDMLLTIPHPFPRCRGGRR